jgi:hypothetical protein
MAPSDLQEVVPMGAVAGAHVTPIDHQYYVALDLTAGRFRYDVRSPMKGNVVMIQHRTTAVGDPGSVPSNPDEYRIVIEWSCSFWVYYDLVTQLDTSITRVTGNSFATNSTQYVRIPVTAGQVIGKIGGQTLDLGVVNADVTLPGFVFPAHYNILEPWKIHTVDPFDYLDEPGRTQLLALNKRKIAPLGGKIDYDIDGRAVGNWFQVGTNWLAGLVMSRFWAGHFSLVYDNRDPSVLVVSIGTYKGASHAFGVKGNGPDFASVSETSGAVKYELVNTFAGTSGTVQAVLLIQVLPSHQMRVEVFPDMIGSQVSGFTSAAIIYER